MLSLNQVAMGKELASKAVKALIDEALLTPKPGLVDTSNSGSHSDMSIDLMLQSAQSLETTFRDIANVSYLHPVNQELRERIAFIGRLGEKEMLLATGGVNTHKGAIWAIGLLTSASAVFPEEKNPYKIMETAGEIASFKDRYEPLLKTHGQAVKKKYRIMNAKEEAQQGFPTIRDAGLPALLRARKAGKSEQEARIESLLALMASVDDTCILHRGSWSDLVEIKRMAKEFLLWDGFETIKGRKTFNCLTEYCESRRLSPGGSADLLAAILFLIS
ncbi:triphosphoribosyl-dephospho-CoA synthase [Neobacillus drentensis]|uniref:triphosphoribosyl-dephospho-CoA synthase n=1 Tax=Neobacillus drentensis TaxID=220684 RepID=UPI001F3DF64A|nr:triphosphoribosyl-dephospho-CoA synthase [Neobacillus drentensis]ULT59770.1 triphosphoribosyl-dephospho-CoA synthase [Neobacillus drentensis]